MTDKAHRSQYDVLALNMRNALPSASFLGFTGTPLIAGEEKTREVFGKYAWSTTSASPSVTARRCRCITRTASRGGEAGTQPLEQVGKRAR